MPTRGGTDTTDRTYMTYVSYWSSMGLAEPAAIPPV